ncbi:MAG: alpha/beta fold hydrolase [Burkholderiaceae bacterium]|nr:alpha/beta fold hydrolase [Burkholderiaceae bacterium]
MTRVEAFAPGPAAAHGERAVSRAGERLEIATGDGNRVVAHRFRAAAPRAAVVIGAALGVRQDFYFDFAAHLAARGLTTFTFDYRGVGHSAPRSLRRYAATLTDWAQLDYEAVLAHAVAQGAPGDANDSPASVAPRATDDGAATGVAPRATDDGAATGAVPLFVVGHSLGAQLAAITPRAAQIDALVAVAGGAGYWRGLSLAARPFMLAMLNAVAPLAIPIAGYFPGARLRMIADLPAGVMRQWRRWCLDPDYLVGVEPGAREAYARVRFPILSLSFSDDRMMPERNIESLHRHFGTTRREVRRITPAEAGGPVGHFGYFRRRYHATLWPFAVDWLLARVDEISRTRGETR